MERTNDGPDPKAFLGMLDALVEVRKTRAQLDALESALFAGCAAYADASTESAANTSTRDAEIIWRSLSMELGAALHLSDQSVRGRMSTAMTLGERFPVTKAAWERGEISTAHVREIVRAGEQIDSDVARAGYEHRIIEIAASETSARTKAIARVMASRIEPEVVQARMDTAVEARCVWVEDLDDGMSKLSAILPAPLAHGIIDRLNQASKLVRRADRQGAKRAKVAAGVPERPAAQVSTAAMPDGATVVDATAGVSDRAAGAVVDAADGVAVADAAAGIVGHEEPAVVDVPFRRADQIRADLFADMLLTGTPSAAQLPDGTGPEIDLGALRGRVQIVVTADSLFGDSTDAPILTGAGPVPIEQARAIAAATPTWDRLTIDPARNTLTAVDRYRPSEEQRRFLVALDEHCRRPGCNRPALDCDIDHSRDWARGGRTELFNLANLCESDHAVKHADGWTIGREPDGSLLWKSKHDRSYPEVPRPAVAFMFSEPPPF